MEGKKSRNCRTAQNSLRVRLNKAKRSMAYALANTQNPFGGGDYPVKYYAAVIARLEAMIAAKGGAA